MSVPPSTPPAGRRKPGRRTPKASVTLWRFTFCWLDLWDNRYGIELSWEGRRWRYAAAVGFGHAPKATRTGA